MKSKGQKFIVDNIGSFQVDAQFQWMCNLKAEVLIFCVAFVTMLLFFTLGFFYLHIQYDGLKKTQENIQMEIQNLKKMKQDTQDFNWSSNDIPYAGREKRESISRGKSSINGKSKFKNQKKQKDDQARTTVPSNFSALKARAVHLERDVSYTETANDGIISHWFVHNWADPAYNFESVLLEGSNSSLVIQNTGLYLVYAQLCYAKTRENNSFEVKVMSEGRRPFDSKTISQCSAGTTSLENEITCYTSLVQVLKAGDRVYLQQTQKKRHLLMNRGRSFMGVVKLS